jgi:hypothetical protein
MRLVQYVIFFIAALHLSACTIFRNRPDDLATATSAALEVYAKSNAAGLPGPATEIFHTKHAEQLEAGTSVGLKNLSFRQTDGSPASFRERVGSVFQRGESSNIDSSLHYQERVGMVGLFGLLPISSIDSRHSSNTGGVDGIGRSLSLTSVNLSGDWSKLTRGERPQQDEEFIVDYKAKLKYHYADDEEKNCQLYAYFKDSIDAKHVFSDLDGELYSFSVNRNGVCDSMALILPNVADRTLIYSTRLRSFLPPNIQYISAELPYQSHANPMKRYFNWGQPVDGDLNEIQTQHANIEQRKATLAAREDAARTRQGLLLILNTLSTMRTTYP